MKSIEVLDLLIHMLVPGAQGQFERFQFAECSLQA